MPLEPGQRIAQYRLVEKIGEGGMGVVWKALDTDLNRHVALKVLPPELTADPERRLRFRREAQAAAALSHPSIAVIHQVGEHEECPFIAMELVAGASLRDRLAAGSLAPRDWLSLALPLAEGLAHAHRHGVVHRDLKPDNVMITRDGGVKILDFGLAKLLQIDEEAAAPGGPAAADLDSRLRTISRELTRVGKVLGTVSYMSPEQARGVPVDHRSDLFSFGVMLYEMIGGHLPFRARSDVETLSAIIAAEPKPISDLAPDVPAEAERIVRKAMEKAAEDRYQSADDLTVDLRNLKRDLDSGRASLPQAASAAARSGARLPAGESPAPPRSKRWVVPVAIAALVLVAVVVLTRDRRSGPDSAGSAPAGRLDSVAVLPFQSRGDASEGSSDEADYLGDGITESVINGLSKIGSVRVVPRSVVFGYKGSQVPPQDIGRELGVAAVVTGRVAQRGDTLDVTAELFDVASVSQLWGERYSGTRAGILEMQEKVTREIARSLRLDVTPEEEREIAQRPTDDPRAYEAYLRGQGLVVFYSEDELERARDYFEEALEIDPDYPLALAGLATVETMLHRNVGAAAGSIERAVDYARRALEIDPGLARAHGALAETYAAQYRYHEAVESAREAVRLDPGEPSYHDTLSWALAYKTPPEAAEAEKEAREAIRLSPRFAVAYYHLGRALIAQGRLDEAIAAFEHTREIDRTPRLGDLGIAQANIAAGRYSLARETLEAHGLDTPLKQVLMAAVLVGDGETDEALSLLEEAVEDGYSDAPFLESSPWFDRLRADPRFKRALEDARKK